MQKLVGCKQLLNICLLLAPHYVSNHTYTGTCFFFQRLKKLRVLYKTPILRFEEGINSN